VKVGIYSPYFGILGGGELYLGTIADILSKGHQVELISESEIPLDSYRKFFGLELTSVRTRKVDQIPFVESLVPFPTRLPKYKRSTNFTADYDLFIIMPRNFRIPFRSLARFNILHLQVPDHGSVSHRNFSEMRNQLVKRFWYPKRYRKFDAVLINSKFHLDVIRDRLQNARAIVLPPPVSPKSNPGWAEKKRLILSVGRFFRGLHNKRHDVLIEAMRKLHDTFSEWRLAIAGGCNRDSESYVEELRNAAKDLPVDFYVNAPLDQLNELYRDAAFYWHAAGFQAPANMPERMEHFGISTVEAMSAGCVPIVFRGGGQLEIVEEAANGFFWQSKEELISKTVDAIQRQHQLEPISNAAAERSKEFSRDRFGEKLLGVLASLRLGG